MKYRYSKFVADLAGDVDLDKLMARLSDLLLSSGFNNPYDPQSDDDRAMQALHDAILDALLNGGALSDEMADRLFSNDGTPEGIERQRQQVDELVQKLIERLGEQGYISLTGKPDPQRLDGQGGGVGQPRARGSRSPTRRSTSGIPRPARSARVAWTKRIWTSRHTRPRHRHRSRRSAAGIRIRRHR
jgi:Ca-activated chloride channel family protein